MLLHGRLERELARLDKLHIHAPWEAPAEALASPRFQNPYAARGGPLSAGLEASTEYKWRPRWRLTLSANYNRLLDDAAASPIVRQVGSADQFSVAGGIRFMLR